MKEVPDTLYEFETIFHAEYPEEFESVWKHIGTKAAIGFHEPEPNTFITEYPGHTKMYEAVTQYCGFPAIEAGKLMGLAPYGKPNDEIPSFFNGEWGNRDLIVPTYPNAATINENTFPILKEDRKQHTM